MQRGLEIIGEYSWLTDISKDILLHKKEVYEISGTIINFGEIPVCLGLHQCKKFYCEFVIRFSYTPYYKRYYVWPGDKSDYINFQRLSLYSLGSGAPGTQKRELNIFRNILKYIEKGNNNFIGKKYGLK